MNHVKITRDELVDLLAMLGVELRTASIHDLLNLVETTTLPMQFLLDVAAEESSLYYENVKAEIREELGIFLGTAEARVGDTQ
jgi:Ca2+-binding EF-hand superfamily protein